MDGLKKSYVERRGQGYWIAASRVSLDSVLFAFLDGLSPETIAAECFPTLTLEQVYGAITYYLAHRVEIDQYLEHAHADVDRLRRAGHDADPAFAARLAQARRATQTTRP